MSYVGCRGGALLDVVVVACRQSPFCDHRKLQRSVCRRLLCGVGGCAVACWPAHCQSDPPGWHLGLPPADWVSCAGAAGCGCVSLSGSCGYELTVVGVSSWIPIPSSLGHDGLPPSVLASVLVEVAGVHLEVVDLEV